MEMNEFLLVLNTLKVELMCDAKISLMCIHKYTCIYTIYIHLNQKQSLGEVFAHDTLSSVIPQGKTWKQPKVMEGWVNAVWYAWNKIFSSLEKRGNPISCYCLDEA